MGVAKIFVRRDRTDVIDQLSISFVLLDGGGSCSPVSPLVYTHVLLCRQLFIAPTLPLLFLCWRRDAWNGGDTYQMLPGLLHEQESRACRILAHRSRLWGFCGLFLCVKHGWEELAWDSLWGNSAQLHCLLTVEIMRRDWPKEVRAPLYSYHLKQYETRSTIRLTPTSI